MESGMGGSDGAAEPLEPPPPTLANGCCQGGGSSKVAFPLLVLLFPFPLPLPGFLGLGSADGPLVLEGERGLVQVLVSQACAPE